MDVTGTPRSRLLRARPIRVSLRGLGSWRCRSGVGPGSTRTCVQACKIPEHPSGPSPAEAVSAPPSLAATWISEPVGSTTWISASAPSSATATEVRLVSSLSNTSVAENSAAGTVVGALSDVDPDAGDTASYALLDDAGGRFAIAGGNLVVAGALDYETATSHQVTIRVTDSANNTYDKVFTIDVTDDPSLVRAMALSGCTGVFVGFESLTDENLSDARKKTPRAEDYLRRVRLLHEHGIQVNGSFVVGFEHDTKACFAELAEWVIAARLESATFHILTPYPNTPLFRKLEAEGRILHREYSKYDTAHAVFRPKHMTPEELEHGYAWLYQRVFMPDAIWARRPTDPRAVPAYLAMSLLYKKSNPLWHALIATGQVRRVWSPMVSLTRRRHARFREELRAKDPSDPFAPRDELPLPGYVVPGPRPGLVSPERPTRRALTVLPAGV